MSDAFLGIFFREGEGESEVVQKNLYLEQLELEVIIVMRGYSLKRENLLIGMKFL